MSEREFENEGSDEIDLRGIFGLLRRQAKLILYTIIFVFGLATIYLFSITPTYTASTLILVDPGQQDLMDPTAQFAGSQAANARIDSEVEMLTSDATILTVVADLGLVQSTEFGPEIGLWEKVRVAFGFEANAPEGGDVLLKRIVDRFKSKVSVARRRATYLISVSVSSADPRKAAEYANALSTAYIRSQLESEIAASLAARDILQSRIEQARATLAASESAFDTFIDTNIDTIARETGRQDIVSLREALQKIERDSLGTEVLANQIQQNLEARNWGELATRLENEAVRSLQSQRAALQERLAGEITGSDQDVDLRAQLALLDVGLETAVQNELSELRHEVAVLQNNATEFRTQIRSSVLGSQLPAEILAQIYEIQQESAIARNQYQSLLERLRDVETQAGLQIADSRIVSLALVPTAPTSPKKKLIMGMSILLAIGIGTGLAFLNEFYVGGFTNAPQLRDVLHLPVASVVPLARSKTDRPADTMVDAPLSPFAESIRRLRATIDQSLRKQSHDETTAAEKGKVILVSSTIPGEGKTTTALSLGRAYALSGKRTLLIDGDLRKPSIHTLLGIEPTASLLEFLTDPKSEGLHNDFFLVDPVSPLEIVVGSKRANVPTDQLLVSKHFESLVAGAAEVFDIVIIDSPPLLPVVDGLYIAHHADAVVFVVRWAMTGQNDVRGVIPALRDAMRPDAVMFPVLSQLEGADPAKYRGYYDEYGGRPY